MFAAERSEAFRLWSNRVYLDLLFGTSDNFQRSVKRYREGNVHAVRRIRQIRHEEELRISERYYHLFPAIVANDLLLRSNCSQTSIKGDFVV